LPPSVTIDTPPIESALWGTLINGEQHNFSASTHDSDTVQAFRLAKLPPFDPHTKGDAAVSVRFMGGQIGNPRFTAHFILSNGSRGFTYEWTRMGSMASQSHAGIRAFAEPDGSISIYEFVGPGYGVGSSTIEFVQGPSTILYPRAQPMTPVGKQVFSSDDPKSYPTTAP
ncbi:MAG TPA: hypothetical protein VMF56_05340, partial [Acidobacteriaceae bacterium]|nr:hypothetical protein [Acidobacteriaceae bacterium]